MAWTPNPASYDFGRPFPAERVVELLTASGMRRTDSQCIYEPGCGTGRILIPLARAFSAAKFTGGEASAEVLEVARKRQAEQAITNLTLCAADVCDPPPGGPYDVIIHSSVLHAVPSWRAALEQLVHSLSPGGRFVLIGDYGDIYREALGRESEAGTDGGLREFWAAYRAARESVHAPNLEASQVGAKWDLESTQIAEQLKGAGFLHFGRSECGWKQEFSVADLMRIVEERCYSSMFTVPVELYRQILAQLQRTQSLPLSAIVQSRHVAVAHCYMKPR